jgi:hypothetical protein
MSAGTMLRRRGGDKRGRRLSGKVNSAQRVNTSFEDLNREVVTTVSSVAIPS